IMASVFFAFALADSVVIKTVGVGIGIAVILDATVVRALVVPATMRLMGRWNWWIPAPIARLCRWVSAHAARVSSSGGAEGLSPRRSASRARAASARTRG